MTTYTDLRIAIQAAKEARLDIPCHTNGDQWFATRKGTRDIAAAKCQKCPIQRTCGRYAHDAREPAGVWGGVDHGAATTAATELACG